MRVHGCWSISQNNINIIFHLHSRNFYVSPLNMQMAKLVDKKVVPVDLNTLTIEEKFSLFDLPKRVVKQDTLGKVMVSTVFLGIDHGFRDRPEWFETLVFGGKYDGFMERCETWEQAVMQHERVVNLVWGTDRD